MADLNVNANRSDPYKNFKFRVELIAPRTTRDDVDLSVESVALLDMIVEQVKYPDKADNGSERGIGALFSGEKGTGRSKAAEVIADQLALDLYRIHLSPVVSKYIGETEKNLRKIFDSSTNGRAVLFFDEADALFGKRSEVKDSHDRYANIEIDYLLKLLENYEGIVILATNRKNNIDDAFVRRLRFVIDFPSPSPNKRKVEDSDR